MLTGVVSCAIRRKQRFWSSSSSSYDAFTASASDAVGATLVSPTSAIWTAICSISRGSPPVALSRRRTTARVLDQVDRVATRGLHPAR